MGAKSLLLFVFGATLMEATANQRCEFGGKSSVLLTPQIQDGVLETKLDLRTTDLQGSQDGDLKLTMKKREGKNFVSLKLSQGSYDLFDELIRKSWLGQGGANQEERVSLSLEGSKLRVGFVWPDRRLVLELTDPKLEGVYEVESDGESLQCIQHTATTTPAISTTPTTTTTTATTTATVTTEVMSPTTKTAGTASNQSLESTTPFGEVSVAGVIDDSEEETNDCHVIPWWTWVCVGISAAFFVFFLLLLCYTIVLCRRNWRLSETIARQGQHLRGRLTSPGGYGEEAQDMHYYAVNNQNLMVGSTMPKLRRTPSPLPPLPAHCTAPRNSAYRRSIANPPIFSVPAAPTETPPPPNFLNLPPDACLVSCPDDDFPNELELLNKDPQDNNRLRCSDDGLADDEVSDVSLSGEYGLRM